MHEQTGKESVYLPQKQSRDAHPERKGTGRLSSEGCAASQKLGRDPPGDALSEEGAVRR